MTVNVWPPTVIVLCRVSPSGFAAAANVTVPLPEPDAPAVTVSHDVALLTAIHEQPAVAVIVVDPVAPPAATVVVPGEIE